MFLQSVRIIETMPCHADIERFKGTARASVDLTEILPFLNAILERPNFQPDSHSLRFRQGAVEFTLREDIVAMTRFDNMTHAYELLDWLKDLINDTYESRTEIEPSFKVRKNPGFLQVFKLLPGKNCGKCGNPSCMAFANAVCKADAEPEDCPLLFDFEYAENRKKLKSLLD